ncbi:MAG: hypothetical protein HeimC2_07000 [Candidatus Heimdallarchaeota archaeon LC_2]|nr:MAG: hypothetical protein HeimC2_07000 [Candidatus Heimdallarchaeota archaeon LC_2]
MKSKFRLRYAEISDSDYLSELQMDYLVKYSTYEVPKSPEKYRLMIGSGLLTYERIIIIEDTNHILGFLEQKKVNPFQVRLSYPYVLIDHEDREELQLKLLEFTIDKLKSSNTRIINIEFSNNIENAVQLLKSFNFTNARSIFQSWEGEIMPDDTIDIEPFDIRKVKPTDLDITYEWIKSQLDRSSPLFIDKDTFASILHNPNSVIEGFAVATIDDKPVALISSLKEENSDIVIIFGPFCDESFINVRIPLLNELFLYYKLKGYNYARILRIREFYNDNELFTMFNFDKKEEYLTMSRLIY